jgi:hypothetical protein
VTFFGISFFTARGPEALNEKRCAKGFARRGWPDADRRFTS